jgi:hypothetical protein
MSGTGGEVGASNDAKPGQGWFDGLNGQRWSADIRIASLVLFIIAALMIIMAGLFLGLVPFDNNSSSSSGVTGPIQFSDEETVQNLDEPVAVDPSLSEDLSKPLEDEFVPENVFEKDLPEILEDNELAKQVDELQEKGPEESEPVFDAMDPDEIKSM